jgi:hypothetical protein
MKELEYKKINIDDYDSEDSDIPEENSENEGLNMNKFIKID